MTRYGWAHLCTRASVSGLGKIFGFCQIPNPNRNRKRTNDRVPPFAKYLNIRWTFPH